MDDKDSPVDGGYREQTIDRRSVLKGAATGTVALTGATAVTGTASAGSCISLTAADTPDDFPMIENGGTRGDFPQGPDELLIFVHGWFEELGGDATGQAYLTKQALDAAGYGGEVVGFQYRGNNPWWWEAKDDAEEDGRAFADWLIGYMNDHPDTTIRLVCHSLGGRASLACLDELQSRGESVTSLSLLGPAVDADSVTITETWYSTEEGPWYDAADNGADNVYNYKSNDDNILEYIYSIGEFGDQALGEEGADGDAPDNYQDVDVTSQISDHCQYFQPGDGCIGSVVDDF